LPVDDIVWLGPWQFEVSSTLSVLGRKFVLLNSERPFLVLIFTIGAFWFVGASVASVRRTFAPLGLGIMGLLVSALAVEPFLYAALLVEIVVLLSIPMLMPPVGRVGQGLLRYLIFQTFAMPFMLLAGWVAGGVEANPADEKLLFQTVVFLGMGFALWLAVFPFYSWVPLLSGETHPYVAGFMLSMLPMVVLMLALDFLNAFVWLREYDLLMPVLRITGSVMVVTAGFAAAFQRDLSCLFGYAVIMENGFALLALSLGSRTGLELLVVSFLPRILGLAVWSMALAVFSNEGIVLTFDGMRGILPRLPLTSGALILAYFSLAGLPILVGFPARQALFELLAEQSLLVFAWVFLGSLGFLASGFRLLAILIGRKHSDWKVGERLLPALFLSGGVAALIITGALPGWFHAQLVNLLQAFEYLQ